MADLDFEFEDPSPELHLDCCIGCNNLNVLRAVKIGNKDLLMNAMKRTKKVSNVLCFQSSDVKITVIDHLIDKQDSELIETFFAPELGPIPKNKSYDTVRQRFYSWRIQKPGFLI